MNCKICGSQSEIVMNKKLLKKYDVKFYQCQKCYFIFTENPYWLDEAYSDAINIFDTGIMERNIHFSKIVSGLIFYFGNIDADYLDYAGGYGIFTRLMRDLGFKFSWTDKYASNLVARGFEADLEEKNKFELITAFEFFEHTVEPIKELKKIFELTDTFLFSTVLAPFKETIDMDWWYFGPEHGQHVSFFTIESLNFLAKSLNLNLYSNKTNLHIFTRKKFRNSEMQKYLLDEQLDKKRFLSSLKKYPENQLLLWIKSIFSNKINYFSFIEKYMKSKSWTDHLELKEKAIRRR